MTDLDKAREWAKFNLEKEYFNNKEGADEAAEIIQSLPDQWVDVGKVREEAERMRKGAVNAMKPGHNEFSRGYAEAMRECARHLRNILTPSLPTLAELLEAGNAPKQYQWMRAKDSNGEDLYLTRIMEEASDVVYRDGMTVTDFNSEFTPLPDLPKLEWPGGVVDCEIVEESEPVGAPPAEKAALPKPEDVPADELWLVECGGIQWFAKRNRSWSTEFAWRLISMVRESNIASDSQITLIHKLVPEPPALPEGMRLADHEEYGRVVVSPAADVGGDYKIFHLDNKNNGRATYRFASPDDLTFLDGDQHVWAGC